MRKLSRQLLQITVLFFVCCLPALAQQGKLAATADKALSDFQKNFTGVAEAMPADKFDFTPASLNIPGAKFANVRTFSEEVKHVAQANYGLFAYATGTKPPASAASLKSAKSREEILKALADSFAFAHQALSTMTDAQALETVDMEGPRQRIVVALYDISHGQDHYGQMVVYLRMNGVVPPASAK